MNKASCIQSLCRTHATWLIFSMLHEYILHSLHTPLEMLSVKHCLATLFTQYLYCTFENLKILTIAFLLYGLCILCVWGFRVLNTGKSQPPHSRQPFYISQHLIPRLSHYHHRLIQEARTSQIAQSIKPPEYKEKYGNLRTVLDIHWSRKQKG